jgi:gliding motility-associated-like protein
MPVVDAGPDQTACDGASVTLSGSGAQSYSWDNGVTDGVAFTPSGTMTYTVTGTAANGCTATDQVTVNVSTSPTIGAGADQSVCPGTSVTLTGTGGVSYSWNNGVTDGVSFTPASTTTYTVTGTDAAGCDNTDQVTVTVYALPPVDAGQPLAVCAGSSVTLNGSGATSYVWNNGVSNGVAFTPGSTTTYTVTGTDANGCQNTDQVTVTVNQLPNVSAGNDQSVCTGGNVTVNGSGASTYSWNNGVTNGTPFAPGATTTYTVTGTDANGCQDTDQMTVTVNPLPVVSAGTDQSVCLGTAVTLSGSGAVSYTWTNGVTNNNAFTPGLGSVTYTVTGTDANGCQNTDQVTVNVVPVPVSDLNSTSVLSGYPGLVVTFTNASTNANSYDFDFDNGQNATSTNVAETFSSTYNSPGIYTIVLTASNGLCEDTSQINVIIIPFEPLIIELPNVFTPDGDGVNDGFYIDVQNGVSIEVIILNRWQNEMFRITDFTTKWDGTVNGNEASEGTYFYKYTIVGKDGTTQSGQQFVELLRK